MILILMFLRYTIPGYKAKTPIEPPEADQSGFFYV